MKKNTLLNTKWCLTAGDNLLIPSRNRMTYLLLALLTATPDILKYMKNSTHDQCFSTLSIKLAELGFKLTGLHDTKSIPLSIHSAVKCYDHSKHLKLSQTFKITSKYNGNAVSVKY